MARKKTVIANMTIEMGTATKPRTIAKGEAFEIDADDPDRLVGRGIAIDPGAAEEEEPAAEPQA